MPGEEHGLRRISAGNAPPNTVPSTATTRQWSPWFSGGSSTMRGRPGQVAPARGWRIMRLGEGRRRHRRRRIVPSPIPQDRPQVRMPANAAMARIARRNRARRMHVRGASLPSPNVQQDTPRCDAAQPGGHDRVGRGDRREPPAARVAPRPPTSPQARRNSPNRQAIWRGRVADALEVAKLGRQRRKRRQRPRPILEAPSIYAAFEPIEQVALLHRERMLLPDGRRGSSAP